MSGAMICAIFGMTACMGAQTTSSDDAPAAIMTEVTQAEAQDAAEAQPAAPRARASLKTGFLPKGSSYEAVASALLSAIEGQTSAGQRVSEARFSLEARKWDRYPTLAPSVSTNDNGESEARLTAEATLLDFGRFEAARGKAEAELQIARIENEIDQAQRVYDALELFLEVERGVALEQTSSRAVARYAALERKVSARVEGGVGDSSERSLVGLRMRETQTIQSGDALMSAAAAGQLSSMTYGRAEAVIARASAGQLDRTGFGAIHAPELAPAVQLALAEHALSKSEFQSTRASMLPRGVVDAYVSRDNNTTDRGVGFQLKSDVGLGFGTGATLEAAQSKQIAAEFDIRDRRESVARKTAELQATYANLQSQLAAAERLNGQAQASIDEFNAQFEVGRRQILDVLSVYATAMDAERRVVNLRYDIRSNRLQLALIKGALLPESQGGL